MTGIDPKHRSSTSSIVPDEAFRSPLCRELLAYWREKAGENSRPKWSDINLMDLYKIAPFISVRDVGDGSDDYRCRFCGTGNVEMLGVDLTGKTLTECYEARGVGIVRERFRIVIESGQPIRTVGYINVVEKNLPTGFEALYLPLDNEAGKIAYLMSIHDYDYEPSPGEIPEPD